MPFCAAAEAAADMDDGDALLEEEDYDAHFSARASFLSARHGIPRDDDDDVQVRPMPPPPSPPPSPLQDPSLLGAPKGPPRR